MAANFRPHIAMRVASATVALTAGCWGLGGSAGAAPLTPVSNDYHEIRVEHSGKCLDVGWFATHHGAGVVQSDCSGENNQKWKIEPVGSGHFKIKALHSGKCLDIAWASQDHAAHAVQANCTAGAANQEWGFSGGPAFQRRDDGQDMPQSDQFYKLVARHSGKCLDVHSLSLANGASVIQANCWNPGNNQRWRVMP